MKHTQNGANRRSDDRRNDNCEKDDALSQIVRADNDRSADIEKIASQRADDDNLAAKITEKLRKDSLLSGSILNDAQNGGQSGARDSSQNGGQSGVRNSAQNDGQSGAWNSLKNAAQNATRNSSQNAAQNDLHNGGQNGAQNDCADDVSFEGEFYDRLASSVEKDFISRREERAGLERQWELNLNFLMGNQYAEISPTGQVEESQKSYFWQGRNVYNHIAPIVETRIAKLARVRPTMSVRAAGSDESDLKSSKMATAILNSTTSRIDLSDVIYKATLWSESLGTSFYSVEWNSEGGRLLGECGGEKVYEGDACVTAVSPFEIFPDSLFHEDVCDLKSLIRARAMHVDDVYAVYGKSTQGKDIDVFSLSSTQTLGAGSNRPKLVSAVAHDNVLVIERYEAPSDLFPRGRVVTVAAGKVLDICDLPYENGDEKRRVFPFIRQVSVNQPGCFFGVSIIERIIPLQRAYNAVKNRKHEYLNRVSMGVVTVEDGSVDTDALTEDGLSPGKVIVYRQGSEPPKFMASATVPPDFSYEESRLEQEFINVSGVSEFSRNSSVVSGTTSGVALELMVEQDETRLTVSAENIRRAVRAIGKQIIRLFKQFAKSSRMMSIAGENNKVELFYFNSSDLTCDDVVFDTENELSYTPAQKKNAVYEMLKSGLLSDDDGNMSMRTKAKILEIIGFGSLSAAQDITNLHIRKAQNENLSLANGICSPDDYDDHAIHVTEHTRFLLSENLDKNPDYKNRVVNHLEEHKKRQSQDMLALYKTADGLKNLKTENGSGETNNSDDGGEANNS